MYQIGESKRKIIKRPLSFSQMVKQKKGHNIRELALFVVGDKQYCKRLLQSWSIYVNSQEDYEKHRIQQLFAIASSLQLESIKIKGTNRFKFQTVSNIFFPNLIILELSKNRIDNIQALQTLNTPNLKMIDVQFNQISSISSLRKMVYTLKLKTIYFCNNPLNLQLQKIRQINCPNLRDFTFCSPTSVSNLNFYSTFLFAIESNNLQNYHHVHQEFEIPNISKALMRTLGKKFKKINSN